MKAIALPLVIFIFVISACKNSTESQPDPLVLQLEPTHATAYGGSDGAVDLTVSGGSTPYQYQWSNGATTQDISNLTAGTYSVTVTDAGTQTRADSATIRQPVVFVFCSNRDGDNEIYLMHTDGSNLQQLTFNTAEEWVPAWSPDGSQIAFASDLEGNYDIYVMNADGTELHNVTNHQASDSGPAWLPLLP